MPRPLSAFLLALACVGVTVAGGVHLLASADTRPLALRSANPPSTGPVAERAPEHATAPALVDARVAPTRGTVHVSTPGFVSWALLDRRNGRIDGSSNMRTPADALGVIRPWLAADRLRQDAARGRTPTPSRLRQLGAVVRGDEAAPADALYRELGGAASIRRMVKACGLSDTRPAEGGWAATLLSAPDAARLGACLADGRAAGTRWTRWLLDQMRLVRGAGDFGVRRSLPPAEATAAAVRNGWRLRERDGQWQVSCLAVGRDWALGVLARYPGKLGLRHGAGLCAQLSSTILDFPPGKPGQDGEERPRSSG